MGERLILMNKVNMPRRTDVWTGPHFTEQDTNGMFLNGMLNSAAQPSFEKHVQSLL